MPAITALAGIGAVRGLGDEAEVSMGLASGPMERPDDQQAGEFTLGAGIWLEGDSGKSGDLGQLIFQLVEQQLVTGGLISRGKRVQPVELSPAHRHRLGGGVELHGAVAERDHRRGQ